MPTYRTTSEEETVALGERLARDLPARGVVLRGATLADVAPHLGVLAGMGVTLFALCALRFRWKLG